MPDQGDHQQAENKMENPESEISQLRERVSQLQEEKKELDAENVRLHAEVELLRPRANGTQAVIVAVTKEPCRIVLRFITARYRIWKDKKQAKQGARLEYAAKADCEKPYPIGNEEELIPEPNPEDLICILCVSKEALDEQRRKFPPWDENQSTLEDFWNGPARHMIISWQDQYDALNAAHRLAKQAFWHFDRKQWPEHALWNFGEHYDQVRFGKEELGHCELSSGEFSVQLNGVTGLRNAVCHPSTSYTMRSLDDLIFRAEQLAVALKDDERVQEIQALRRTVRERAQEAYDIIESQTQALLHVHPQKRPAEETNVPQDAVEEANVSPQPAIADQPYPFHIQRALQRIAGHLDNKVQRPSRDEYPPVLALAAARWAARGLQLGADDPGHQQRLLDSQSRSKANTKADSSTSKDDSNSQPKEGPAETDSSKSKDDSDSHRKDEPAEVDETQNVNADEGADQQRPASPVRRDSAYAATESDIETRSQRHRLKEVCKKTFKRFRSAS
ncbi:hypothetical protein CKM354_000481700 [Cercospora kikuchii]|uniref:Uncharacterized protein n=1 Tax=Cercospora kikuchii TaxID=84275 RepID=A0A9P3CC48_9PEZI|nr:uncharacterized protein CKM354_000481700 [Cercospora kikuchii]GIZ41514.1 hypothetical protein CKM354_000481700 [Cercospora kikuchii]